ncbi:hypothetical protein D8B46_02100 [Candidatus Gracilibacteria bacterium]|nr:MAG: hypothetical protein D8B46_02100 [Candidatus Gracilibacteria bacterium]
MVGLDNYTGKDLRDKSEHIAEEKSKSIKESKKNISNLSSELSEEEKKFFEKFDKEVNLDNLTSYLDVSDGELVIAGRPFTYLRRRHYLPKVDLNSLENTIENLSKKNDIVILLSEIYDIWAKEAYNQQASLWFRRFRKSDFDVEGKEFLTSSDFRKMGDIDGLENAVKYAGITIEDIYSYDGKDFEKKFEKVFFYMMQGEKKESIIGESDMEEIKKIFFDKNLSIEQKRLKIFDLMRYGGWSGNSVGVKDHLADSILFQRGKDGEFVHKDLKNILENERINEILSDVSIDKRDSGATNKIAQNKLESFLGKEYKDCAKSIIEAYKKSLKETKRSLKHHYEEEKKENEQLKNVTFEEYLEKALNGTTIESIALNGVKYAIKHILVSYKIEKMDYRGDKKNSFTGIYANTIGLAENKGFNDYFVVADENIDSLVAFGVNIAIGVATMGAGMLASRAGLYLLGRTGLLQGRIAAGVTSSTVGRWAAHSIYEGVVFYEGSNIAANVIFGEGEWKDITKGWNDKERILHSVAFMGFLGTIGGIRRYGVNKISAKAEKIGIDIDKSIVGWISNPKAKLGVNPSTLKKMTVGTLSYINPKVFDGSMMYSVSLALDTLVGEGWNPSFEQWLEFCALIAAIGLKDAGKKLPAQNYSTSSLNKNENLLGKSKTEFNY